MSIANIVGLVGFALFCAVIIRAAALEIWQAGRLRKYANARLESLLAPDHWAEVVRRVGAMEPGFRLYLSDSGTAFTLEACGATFWWNCYSQKGRVYLSFMDGGPFPGVSSRLAEQFREAVRATWPDYVPTYRPPNPPPTEARIIERAEEARRAAGCP